MMEELVKCVGCGKVCLVEYDVEQERYLAGFECLECALEDGIKAGPPEPINQSNSSLGYIA